MVTRPEPTIYGNCDSWKFIAGKKTCNEMIQTAATFNVSQWQ